jgi:putative sterol carrier protein
LSVDPEAIDPVAFADQVGKTPDAELEAGMRSDARRLVLNEIFKRMQSRLRAGAAAGVNSVIHWKIGGRPDGGADHYELVVRDGACRLSETPREQPTVTLKMGAVDFLKLVTGHADGPSLFMQGKLAVDGDLTLAARLPVLFELPRAAT